MLNESLELKYYCFKYIINIIYYEKHIIDKTKAYCNYCIVEYE